MAAIPPTMPPPPGAAWSRTNKKASWSLGLGIASMLFVFLAIPALILGYKAKREIAASRSRGYDMAIAGIVLGWIGLAFVVLVIILGFVTQ
jgi:Domain of unknown function (DUF4190)